MELIYNPDKSHWQEMIKRPFLSLETLQPLVDGVFKDVENRGDTALREYTEKFDGTSTKEIKVSQKEINTAIAQVSEALKEAIVVAKINIEAFHSAQKTNRLTVETTKGVVCSREHRPISKVGIYVPGGTAPLFSTVLMLAIPAQIAGCKNIIICSPPKKKGNIAPEILYAASICGITNIFKVGGSQAIAAMAFGTESIPKVYKIFGPGNQYVTLAKQHATKYGLAIDMPAGPSELLILADDTADASFIAADLLSQAEHGADSQVVLVTLSKDILNKINEEIVKQIEILPRKDIAKKAIENSKLIYFKNKDDAMSFINDYAPEHLIIVTKDNNMFIEKIENAGSVFIGNYTPESAGDYASGTNHTLPTNGFAKNFSGVNLASFQKSITFQEITKEGLQNIGKTIETMAESEGLQAHKNAVSIRLKKIRNEG